MSGFISSIKTSFKRRKVRKILERWKKHHSVVDGDVLSRHFDISDIYVDLYWYAKVGGSKREVHYSRHSFDNFAEYLERQENERVPDAYRAFKRERAEI